MTLRLKLLRPSIQLSFSYWHADPRALHSFPTRRSSDLTFSGLAPYSRNQREPCQVVVSDRGDHFVRAHAGQRSEEHTSELQSRENLVCRLLLEKKKHSRRY